MSNVATGGYGLRPRVRGAGPASYGYDGYLAVLLTIQRESSTRVMTAASAENQSVSSSSSNKLSFDTVEPQVSGVSAENTTSGGTGLRANDAVSTMRSNEAVSREASLLGASDVETPDGESRDSGVAGTTTDPAEPVEE